MGVAIISGVLASLDAKAATGLLPPAKWESHTPGTLTPRELEDESLPSRFLACVSREESAKKLRGVFHASSSHGYQVEIVKNQNVQAVQSANVVILW